MPSPEQAFHWQRILLWQATGGYDRFGQPNVAASPTEINARALTTRSERVDKDGNTVELPMTALVEQRVPIDSRIWFGTLSNWLGTGSAYTDEELMVVKDYGETPDIKARDAFYSVKLFRFHNKGGN